MAKGGGHRRARHRPQSKVRDNSQAGTSAKHIQQSATSGPSTIDRETESAIMVRELADTLYAELGQILLREYGKTSEQILGSVTHSDNNISDTADQVPVFRDKDAVSEECSPAEDTGDLQSTCKRLEEENQQLRAQLAEREAENEGLQQQVAAQRKEIEVARGRAARLDARTAGEARTDMDRPMTLPELRAVFRGLYRQYMLREEHFIAVERAASLESQLWQEKCAQVEKRESAHLDELRDLRQSIEALAQQRPAQYPSSEALRERLAQCQMLVQVVSGETAALRADYTAKMQGMDQHLRLMTRDRMDIENKLRSTQADNQRLDEVCRDLQTKWQQQAWELHSSKRMLEDRLQSAADRDMTPFEAAMRHTAAVATAALFGNEGATMTGVSVQSSMSPPRPIRMPRRPRHNGNRRGSALHVAATTDNNDGQPHSMPDQRDSVGALSAQSRFLPPTSADFTFSLPLSAEIQPGVSAV
ncbi:hypothetical protein H4R27_004403 [Coemansia aciculifera]|nr:hypothetical protein H4R27_004403 [Coemansia aciculifera]